MASLELFGFDELADAYLRIREIPWPVMEKALDEMADTGLRKIRDKGREMDVYDPESNVHILDKLKRRKAVRTDSGGYADVTFSGSRTSETGKRTLNARIAFENEYGNRRQAARPFVRTIMEGEADEILGAADEIMDWVEDTFNQD